MPRCASAFTQGGGCQPQMGCELGIHCVEPQDASSSSSTITYLSLSLSIRCASIRPLFTLRHRAS